MKRHASVVLLLLLAACGTPVSETVAAAARVGTTWQLAALDGTPYPARLTMEFLRDGSIKGEGPCNSFTARQTLPLPWFAVSNVMRGAASCPEQEAEERFFAVLEDMEFAEVADDTLLLSGGTAHTLEFRRQRRRR